MTRRNIALTMTVLLAAASLGACRKKPEAAPVPATVPVADNGAAQRRADSLAADAARRRAADSLANARANMTTEADAQRVQTVLKQTLKQVVYFDYDKDILRDDARIVLDAKAAILGANPAITVVVTGHTDEQGTAEYNLALGQRRAAQVKRYLVSKGVQDARLTTQSLGDSQPAVQGTDETAYQQNRRAEFEAANASGALARPKT
jgi:peptidoglycan-associated lipoprotein